MEFAAFLPAGLPADGTASLLLLLALVGFGAKAGLMPLHVWMPEAYPVAPCHISAFMSGAMSKAGIYGLLRVLTFLGQPQEWWPVLLVVVGLVTAIMGILMALSKANLKRMLAYSSVENIGIITTGIGLGLLGQQAGHSALAALGFGGAILHVLNHALMKGLLFLAAGTVLGATGTVVMDRLGGLMKRLPLTGLAFVLGAAAMCGLPPLNGFASELLMYMCAGLIGIKAQTAMAIPAWGAVAGLAFAGGMAAYAFAKAVGTVFLGEPRTADGHGASEPSLPQRATVALLAAGCVMAGLGAPWLLGAVAPAVSVVLGPAVQVGQAAQAAEIGRQALAPAAELLGNVVRVAAPLVGLALVLAWLRLRLLAGRPVGEAGTWDCGYLAPSNRVQYTGSSFSQPMIELMHPALHVERGVDPVRGLFPGRASFRLAAPDWMREYLYDPLMDGLDWGSDHLKWLQHGNVNLYILYIVITLVALLAWRLW
jgi:hydrogenase-4 component B